MELQACNIQKPQSSIRTYGRVKISEATTWIQKTRPTNKLRLNMKKILNPEWQKEKLIEIDESTSEAESQSKKIEGMISKALENIEENIKSIQNIAVDKGKVVIPPLSK